MSAHANDMTELVSDDALKEAHIAIAKIVVKHGDQYLPIFERLEQEIAKRSKRSALLRRAFTVASDDQEP